MRRVCLPLGLLLAACTSNVAAPPSSTSTGSAGGGAGGGAEGGGGTAPMAVVGFVDAAGVAVDEIRYGDAFAVTVSGLEPFATIRLDSSFSGYTGWASFAADDQGEIDTRLQAPTEGSYQSISPEGLLWSMELQSAADLDTLDITISASIGDEAVHEATLHRSWLNEGLVDETVTEGGLVGKLWKPGSVTEPLPALIVLGGSEGGLGSADFRASWMAGYGYAALALAYFDEPGLPDDLAEVPLEYFETALDYLAARADVDADNIGVMGTSRGGELVLMLGARFPRVKAVVAEVPSGLRWGAVMTNDASGWSFGGVPLPYMSDDTGGMWVSEPLPGGGTGFRSTPMFEVALDDSAPATLAAATIPVEQGQTPYLMLAGQDDGVWPSCTLAQITMDRLIQAGHDQTYADEIVCFENAGHQGGTPGWPTTDSYAAPAFGTTLVFGGTPEGVAHFERESLDKTKAFLAAHLQD